MCLCQHLEDINDKNSENEILEVNTYLAKMLHDV